MAVDHYKLNQAVVPIAAAVPNGFFFFFFTGAINTSPGTWYAVIDLEMLFLSISVRKEHQKKFVFSWQSQQYTFTVPLERYTHVPALML